METKAKLMLKGLSHETGMPFIMEIHSLDEVKKTGNYVVIGKNISTANGLPHLNDNTPQCFCCEGNLMVTCCYSAEEAQSNTTYGQTLIISDKESGLTNTYTRTINPAKNNGKWSSWKMMVNGEISVVAPTNELYERVSQISDTLAGEVSRATEAEQQLNDSLQTIATEKADKDGYYSKLTTGFSDNLVGRGEAVEAQFTFRPTGGTQSVEDGVARIERIKGNTIVWNQLAQPRESITTDGLTIESVGDGSYKLYTAEDAPTTADVFYPVTDNLIGGHKVVFCGGTATCALKASSGVQDIGAGAIIASAVADEVVGIFVAAGTIINTAVTIFPQVFDVTKMFGTGAADRPTTVDDFRIMFPKHDYSYNDGELLSLSVSGIKSVGFNQFNKATAKKGYVISNGAEVEARDYLCSDYIKVIPGKTYYISYVSNVSYLASIALYDTSCQFLKMDYVGSNGAAAGVKFASGKLTISDSRVGYIRVNIPQGYLDKCCVNFSHTGYRDGEYEAYEETIRLLPIKEFFSAGMNSARNTFDELTATQAIKRVGIVEDLGKLTWYEGTTESGRKRYSASIGKTDSKGAIADNLANINCPILIAQPVAETYYGASATGIIGLTEGSVYVYNPSWQTTQAVKSALAGVNLAYELKTPVVIELSEPLNLDYEVSDFGTEEAITDVVSAPMKMDVVYGFNAVDTIRNNRTTIESLLARVAELESKMQ